MESKASFAIVGLFVLLLGVAMVSSLFWLFGGGRGPTATYVVETTESVSGLTPNAAVKYRGVDVGRVARVAIDPDDPEIVVLTLEIVPGVPVREDTRAQLEFQGLTGLAFVNLIGGSKESPPLRRKRGEDFPRIQSVPSILTRLDTGVSGLLVSLTETSDRLGATLERVDREALARAIASLEKVAGALAARTDEIDGAARDAALLARNWAFASERFPGLVEELEEVAKEWRATGVEVRELAASSRDQVDRTSARVQGEVGVLSTELRSLIARLDRVVAQLEGDPSAVLFGPGGTAPGPGE
jgi:phospholipid/cholesterol/gamma-HCH transport system substrate-binding protein